jgi:hypothetical protein
MDINRKDVHKMLRDIGTLEKNFDYDHYRRTFVKEFRKDLNVLFEAIEDGKEDFRKSLVVILLDIVDQIKICGFEREELIVIKDMTTSLLNPVTKKKLDYYVSLSIEKRVRIGRNVRSSHIN